MLGEAASWLAKMCRSLFVVGASSWERRESSGLRFLLSLGWLTPESTVAACVLAFQCVKNRTLDVSTGHASTGPMTRREVIAPNYEASDSLGGDVSAPVSGFSIPMTRPRAALSPPAMAFSHRAR